MRNFTLLIFCLSAVTSVKGQANSLLPAMPGPPQPATMQRYDNFSGATPNVNGQVRMGATAEDILRQANRNNPYYNVGSDPASIQRANEAWIRAQMANDPAYNPSLRNGTTNNYPLDKQQELINELKDIVRMDNNRAKERGSPKEDYNSAEFISKTKSYNDALQTLKNMLSGKRKASISEAYFIMENAYGEAYLTHDEFNSIIHQSVAFIDRWMVQNKLNRKDNDAINYAVQKFMGDEIKINEASKSKDGKVKMQTITHLPFFYDYNDYQADKDHRNYFLTKCLATGSGQCNSMPAVYLVLVEALGGEAHLSIAPQHSFVKYHDKAGNLRNFEPTSNWDISNQWYQEHMFISKRAVQSGIYLNPLSQKQLIADIILQLSFGYFKKFGAADSKFINDCINTAKTQFPQNNDIAIYFTRSNLYGYQLAQAMRKNRITNLNGISQSTETQTLYERWLQNEQTITDLGYQDEPENMYQEMMKEHEFKGRIQSEHNIDGKTKRSQFLKSK